MGWMFFFDSRPFQHAEPCSTSSSTWAKRRAITDGIIRPLYGNMNVILLFLVPFITMRLFAEEKKNHTIEL